MADDVKSLLLSIGADVSLLKSGLGEGKSEVASFESVLESLPQATQDAITGAGDAFQGLPRQLKKAFSQAKATLSDSLADLKKQVGDTDLSASFTFDVAGAKNAAAAKRQQAQVYTQIAEAANRAAVAEGADAAETLQVATAAKVAAAAAHLEADALAAKAGALERVQIELGTVNGAQNTATTATKGSGQAAIQASQQFQDFFIQVQGGQSILVALSQQGSQLAFVLKDVGGTTGKVASIFAGPYGIAIFAATALLGPLIANLITTGDETDKTGKSTLTLVEALSAEKFGTEAATKALREYNDEQDRKRKSDSLSTAEAIGKAEKRLQDAIKLREQYKRDLDNAIASRPPTDGDTAGTVGELARPAKLLADIDKEIKDLRTTLRNLRVEAAGAAAQAAVDPIAKINDEFDRQADAAKRAAAGNDALAASIERTLTAIEKRRKAALDAERERQSADKKDRRDATSGRVTPGEVGGDLQRQFGGSFSGTRSAKRNAEVGGAANSFHLRGQAVDFVPKGGVGSISKAQLRDFLESQGYDIKELLGPGDKGHSDHFHVAFGTNRLGADAVAKRDEAERAKAERFASARERFQASLADADQQLLDARHRLVLDADELALIEREQVQSTRNEAVARVNADKDLTAAEKQQLIAKQDTIRDARLAVLAEQERLRKTRDAADLLTAGIQNEEELLRAQVSITTSRQEQRTLELRLLDLQYERERAELAAIQATHATTSVEYQVADARLKSLGAIKEAERSRIERDTAGPGQRYLKQLQDDAANVNDALQQIQAEGLKSLNDGITDAIVNGKDLGDVFHNIANQIIADLIRIAVQRAIVEPIANALFSGSSFAGIGKIFGFADGGDPPVGKVSLVGERGPELFVPKVPGTVISNDNLRSMGNGGTSLSLVVNAPGATAETVSMIRRELAAAAPQIVAAAKGETIRDLRRARL